MSENNKKPDFFQLYLMVGEIRGKVEAMDTKLDRTISNHENRINDLENGISTMKGKAVGAGVVAGFFTSLIGLIIGFFGLRK